MDTLRLLFNVSKNEQALPTYITEVTDDIGTRRYKFTRDYAKLLTRVMHLITNILNDYWKTAGMVETFSFGWSYHYDMEFSKLVYKKWATRLVLESIKDGLLARIQLAMEAVEECYSCTGHVSNMPKLITMAQVTTQDRYLQAEDLQWE